MWQALVAAWKTGEEMPFLFDTVMTFGKTFSNNSWNVLLQSNLMFSQPSTLWSIWCGEFICCQSYIRSEGCMENMSTPICAELVAIAIGQVWDLIKLMDYLTGRPDIDPSRIGMMGISLGGMLADGSLFSTICKRFHVTSSLEFRCDKNRVVFNVSKPKLWKFCRKLRHWNISLRLY